ncbi:MAG: hypothetical protein LBN21_03690 [Treponema sp.]|jgi:hypothetical protein|nr:hypothetical protein [Treponema sp.]
MSDDGKVIWKKGDGPMPEKVQHVVACSTELQSSVEPEVRGSPLDAARGEQLLQTLQLPEAIENTLRYNADKSAQSINDYVSRIVVECLASAS